MAEKRSALIVPVLLSGGSGTRLWPMSRSLYPKQLLALVGEHSRNGPSSPHKIG